MYKCQRKSSLEYEGKGKPGEGGKKEGVYHLHLGRCKEPEYIMRVEDGDGGGEGERERVVSVSLACTVHFGFFGEICR